MPLHPAIVHFPIVLVCIVFVFELVALITKNIFYSKLAQYFLIATLAGIGAAILTGGWEEDAYKLSETLEEAVADHENLAYLSAWYFGLLLVWRMLRKPAQMFLWETYAFLLAILAGIALVFFTGHNGGVLVYELGILG